VTISSRDVTAQVTRSLDGRESDYDIDAIVAEHDTSEIHFVIEVSDDGAIWMPEKDEARGTEPTDGETPAAIAKTILDNRIADLAAEDLTPGHMRVRVWADQEDADAGLAPLAEATAGV